MDQLVSADWLAAHLDDDDLRVFDCTTFLHPAPSGSGLIAESGRARWSAGHIPGCGFADLTGDLSDQTSPLRFIVPSVGQFAAAAGRLGIGDDTRVVLYDSARSMWAARVWWMLRWAGFDNAVLLDGGWQAWEAGGHPTSTGACGYPPATLTPAERPRLIATKDDVLAAIGDGATCLIDALGEAQYRGDEVTYGRAGHIPGATNSPAMDLIDPVTGRYRPVGEMEARFEPATDERVIVYCGGGIAASSDAFALTLLGYTDVAVYTASLQEWVADPAAPLVTD